MEDKNKDQPAFPCISEIDPKHKPGLTKRELGAFMIMAELVGNNFSPTGFQNGDENSLSKTAVKCTDALLKALEG